MPKSVNLPLYDTFLKIFIEHKIINWQAKDFWEKVELDQLFRTRHCKRQMYTGLKILVRCEYLKIDLSKSSKKAFSYNESARLDELRDSYKKQKLKPIFSMKKAEFLNEISEKENNIQFIESLLSTDKTLEKYFIIDKEKLENDIKNIKSNIKFMDNIIN